MQLTPSTAQPLMGLQRGYSMPAKRLITYPWSTRRSTANISTPSCLGSVRIPRLTIKVVAPAGGAPITAYLMGLAIGMGGPASFDRVAASVEKLISERSKDESAP
jgi:hypothetical protein